MSRLNINEEEFFYEVTNLTSKGYSISNAIKKLMGRPEYKFNFNQLRNLYYRLKKKGELLPEYDTNIDTNIVVKKDDTYYPGSYEESKGFLTSIKDFFRNLF